MGLFRKRENRADGEVQFDDALLQAMLGGGSVTKKTALQVPTVSGGVDLIANIVAGTPIKLYHESNGKTEEVRDDYRIRLLNDETGDTLNANEFWKAIVRDYYVGKGGYAYINKERGRIKSLHYVDESKISIAKNNDPIFKDFDIMVNGRSYRPYDFLKVLRNSKDGATGTPITEESSKLIEVAYQSLCFECHAVKKGGAKKGFLRSENKLAKEELDALREAYSKLYGNNSENMMVLNKGVEFQELSDTAAEMQMNENKRTNAEEFAKIFHISTGVMSGNATESDTASLAKLAAIPLMTTIQCALNKDFLLEKEKGEYYWAFDTKELLKGDMKERFEAYKTALDANFMQIDEVRYAEDMEPLGMTWVKLGLQDVLYDPKTKQIYTPNTNKTSVMGEEADENDLKAVEDKHIIEPRANPNHDPKTGRFTTGSNSGLTGGSKSGNLQSSKDVSATGENRFEEGFTEKNLERHFKKHGNDYPDMSMEEYDDYAMNLVQSAVSKDILGYKTADGAVVRYRVSSNDFVKGYPKGGIATMYKPRGDGSKGLEYYKRKKKEESVDD